MERVEQQPQKVPGGGFLRGHRPGQLAKILGQGQMLQIPAQIEKQLNGPRVVNNVRFPPLINGKAGIAEQLGGGKLGALHALGLARKRAQHALVTREHRHQAVALPHALFPQDPVRPFPGAWLSSAEGREAPGSCARHWA